MLLSLMPLALAALLGLPAWLTQAWLGFASRAMPFFVLLPSEVIVVVVVVVVGAIQTHVNLQPH